MAPPNPVEVLTFHDLTCARRVRLEIKERPEAQPRPGSRAMGGSRYNPKSPQMKKLRNHLWEVAGQFREPNVALFGKEMLLIVVLTFHLPRPRAHLKKKNGEAPPALRQPIREAFKMAFVKRRIDVDNLCKFILDAMNGPMYDDDSQVVKLVATKIYDDDGDCTGRTSIAIEQVWGPHQLGLSDKNYMSIGHLYI